MKLAKQDLGKVAITVEKEYWNSIRAYDRLVIVEVLGVGCYISRKPVPAGIQYDNRDYWIRMSKYNGDTPTPTPGEFPIVTEFGDNVDVTIAQKTITDKFTDVDDDLLGIHDTLNINFESIEHRLERAENGDIPAINQSIDNVEDTLLEALTAKLYISDFNQFVNEEYTTFKTHTNSRLSSHSTFIANILTSISTNFNEIGIKSKHAKRVADSLYGSDNVYFIKSGITNVGDDATAFISRLKLRLGFDNTSSTSGSKYKFVSSNRLTYSELMHRLNYAKIDTNNFEHTRALVIQLDSAEDPIGDKTDIPSPGDTEVAENLYGGLTNILDEVHSYNPECQIFLITPPNATNSEFIKSKITAINDIAEAVGAHVIDPNTFRFSPRYSELFDTITIPDPITEEDVTWNILSSDSIGNWVDYVAHELNYNFIYYISNERN